MLKVKTPTILFLFICLAMFVLAGCSAEEEEPPGADNGVAEEAPEPASEDEAEKDQQEEETPIFSILELDAPAEVEPEENFTVTAAVKNEGEKPGEQEIEFKINEELIESKEISLDKDERREINFGHLANAEMKVEVASNNDQATAYINYESNGFDLQVEENEQIGAMGVGMLQGEVVKIEDAEYNFSDYQVKIYELTDQKEVVADSSLDDKGNFQLEYPLAEMYEMLVDEYGAEVIDEDGEVVAEKILWELE